MEFADYKSVKRLTTMNVANSVLMSTNIMDSIINKLSAEELEALREMDEHENKIENVLEEYQQDMDTLKDIKLADEIREKLHERIGRTKDFLARLGKLQQDIDSRMNISIPKLDRTIQMGIEEGMKTIHRSVTDLLSFGVGEGQLRIIPYKDIMTLATIRSKNRNFSKVLDELSRQTKFKEALKKSTAIKEQNQSYSDITSGDDISKALPTEIMEAGVDQLEDCFYERFLDNELDIIDDTGSVPKQKGKFIVLKDGSGSMHYGGKSIKADATSLAAIVKAKEDRRETAILTFGNCYELAKDEFPVEGLSIQNMIDGASKTFGGGTNFEMPINEAMKMINSGAYKSADMLILTDGECNVSNEFVTNFIAFKKANNVKCVAVYINVGDASRGAGTVVLEKFCDKIILLSDLMEDEELLTTIFTM